MKQVLCQNKTLDNRNPNNEIALESIEESDLSAGLSAKLAASGGNRLLKELNILFDGVYS